MAQQTPAQARVVDPVLTEHVRGYKNPQFRGNVLFPRVPVASYGGRVIEFGKEDFRRANLRRAPGGATKRLDLGYEGKPYSITPMAVEVPVARELATDAAAVPRIDLGRRAANRGMRATSLEIEGEQAEIATNADLYDADHKVTLAGSQRWTDDAAEPSNDIENAREAIRMTVGTYPNVVMLSAKAMKALRHHPKIIDRTKYTSRDSATPELLAALWGVDTVVVAGGLQAEGQDDTLVDMWGTHVIVAYVNTMPMGPEEPSYGYTYHIPGHPMVEAPYWDANRKSWMYGVSDDATPVLSGMSAGFLIVNAGDDS